MRVLFAARLVDFKDPITFIRASLVLPQHKFVVAGDGQLFDECRRMAGSNVTFLGWVAQPVVNENMLNSEVFCQLSPVENIWSSSMILAMKYRKAIVCTNVGYTPRFLKDGVHALMIPARDENALVDALIKLQHDDLRLTLGTNAYQYYREFLDMPTIAGKIHDLVHAACSQAV